MLKNKDIRVLVADSDPVSLKLMTACLEVLNIGVEKAKDFSDAWNLIQSQEFDIILADINMPGGGGFELLSRLRSKDVFEPKIFFVSGDERVDVEKVFNEGGDGIIYKPFDASTVRDIVQHSCLRDHMIWATPFRRTVGHNLRRKIKTISNDSSLDLHFGRGGFFCKEPANLPRVGDTVAFELEVEEHEKISKISGTGIARWVRMGTGSGYGVEIKYIDDQSRSPLYQELRELASKSYIPTA